LKRADVKITIQGTPGNDLAIFMDGPTIHVKGNAQDGVANTMNSGEILIHGHAGDVIGYAMRGGSVLVRDSVGNRVGINMKASPDSSPLLIVGGCTGNFLGEYMAGGTIIVLGLTGYGRGIVGNYIATGMHGGVIYVRGRLPRNLIIGREASVSVADEADRKKIRKFLPAFCRAFTHDLEKIMEKGFMRVSPASRRPYGGLYTD
jgi:glutamate synthase domain-containing protein 3